jgi:excisionase family DNA binding protein
MTEPSRNNSNGGSRDLLFDTKAVAGYLKVNEKMVYALVSEKGLPATKVTGKWLFPKQLVDQWLETHTRNYPESRSQLPPYHGLLIITGSNDPLLDKTLALFNRNNSGQVAVFGNLGSMGGLQALRQGLCHIAASHLLQEDDTEYNFEFAIRELNMMPAVINFCRREQGILVARNNPKKVGSVADLGQPGVRIVNRQLGTGTRLLLDRELKRAGINAEKIEGYRREVYRHLDVGLEILAGRADAGPGIRAVAGILDLDFIPLRWERFDFMIAKERFFEEGIQRFLGLLHETDFRGLVSDLGGYDTSLSGKMVFPNNID